MNPLRFGLMPGYISANPIAGYIYTAPKPNSVMSPHSVIEPKPESPKVIVRDNTEITTANPAIDTTIRTNWSYPIAARIGGKPSAMIVEASAEYVIR